MRALVRFSRGTETQGVTSEWVLDMGVIPRVGEEIKVVTHGGLITSGLVRHVRHIAHPDHTSMLEGAEKWKQRRGAVLQYEIEA